MHLHIHAFTLENATLKNELKMKGNKITALYRRIKKLSGDLDMHKETAIAMKTSCVALQVKMSTLQPSEFDRANAIELINTTNMKNDVPTSALTSWVSGEDYLLKSMMMPYRYLIYFLLTNGIIVANNFSGFG